jgi:hypothetical protein
VWYLGPRWLIRRGSVILHGFPGDAASVADAVKAHLGNPRAERARTASLLAPLRLAQSALSADPSRAACVAMAAFALARSCSGRQLTVAQAAQLVAGATRVRDVIGCGT